MSQKGELIKESVKQIAGWARQTQNNSILFVLIIFMVAQLAVFWFEANQRQLSEQSWHDLLAQQQQQSISRDTLVKEIMSRFETNQRQQIKHASELQTAIVNLLSTLTRVENKEHHNMMAIASLRSRIERLEQRLELWVPRHFSEDPR